MSRLPGCLRRSRTGRWRGADRGTCTVARRGLDAGRMPLAIPGQRSIGGRAVTAVAVSVRDLTVQYGRRLVFQEVSFDIAAGQSLGVLGPNGSGKTTLLRTLAGCLVPRSGDIRIGGLTPRDALIRTGVAYFAGDATLPGSVRASRWGSLGNGDIVTPDRRPIRALSRGTRQLLG